jgi:hypothetical protein
MIKFILKIEEIDAVVSIINTKEFRDNIKRLTFGPQYVIEITIARVELLQKI